MKLHTIQVDVLICPSCGGSLKHNQIMQKYLCHHCGTRFKVIGFGQSERELICEEERKHGTEGNIFISWKDTEPSQTGETTPGADNGSENVPAAFRNILRPR